MTMSETTVGLSDNNLFGNLIASTRPSLNNPCSQTLNTNSIQSDTTAGDEQNIENADDIPFQEILGLHLSNLNSHDIPNSPVPHTPAVEITNIELAQESVTEANPSMLREQKSDPIQPADFLQKTFMPYPESAMQGFGNNLSPNRDNAAGSANLNIYNPFADVNNGHPSISPFVPPSQRESKWGFEEQKGINVPLDKQFIETHNPGSIFSLEKSHVNAVDEMDKPFIQDMDVGNTLPKTDAFKLNPLSNPKTQQVSGESSINNIQPSNLSNPDIHEITESSKQDIASISQTNEKWNLFGNHTQKQNTSDTVSFDAHTPKTNNGSHFSLDSHTTINNAQSNATDFQQNTKTSPNSGAPLSSSIEDAKTINHIYHSNNMRHFPGSDIYEVNVKELPETYKQSAQNVSPENKNGVPIPAINNSSNAKEQLTENGLSKINGTVSLKQDISSISQTNEEWNSSDSHTQKQNTSDIVSFDAHIPKTNTGSPFSLDSQTTASNAQANLPDFHQNTKASPHSGAPLSSSAADAKTVNHLFHSNDVPGVEHAQENIMEQIFQKIRITTHGDRSEIKLSLNPPELGNIKIHFMEEHDEIEAKIYVENAEVKAAIEKNAHHLKESVAANGVEIHKLEVSIQNDDANKQKLTEYFDAHNHHHNQTHSQKGYDEDQILSKEDIPGNLQTETSASTSNLMVDYLI